MPKISKESETTAYEEGLVTAVNRLSQVPEIQNAVLAAMPTNFHIPDQEANFAYKGDLVWWYMWSIVQAPDLESNQ